ncbi:nuclear transport factor 2 family protein [Stenotrophomonas mori]|uniref:Nuclear transport factor 2 family protein n=1 Tax=Stenotrophomonas mori TaxID=2871096 RepID=A0ABT0SKE4_9GAMM|nr:nuclear transport factor 2 family protein [Stenotrophomonas mori]MCL7715796.1 nuclear transport factor 2 family protein [Stenotrophomonas mori]
MDTLEKQQLVKRYIAAYNTFDIEGMLATLSADVAFQNLSAGQVTAQADGKDAFRALAEKACGLFSEREQTVVSLQAVEDTLVADIAYRGRLAVDVGDTRAGTLIALAGQSVFSFGDGRITRVIDHS